MFLSHTYTNKLDVIFSRDSVISSNETLPKFSTGPCQAAFMVVLQADTKIFVHLNSLREKTNRRNVSETNLNKTGLHRALALTSKVWDE